MYFSRIAFIRTLCLALVLVIASCSFAQRLFPMKLNDCQKQYCFDCGDEKAGVDQKAFSRLFDRLTMDFNLEGWLGYSDFQVNIDSLGNACVVSASNMYTPKVNQQFAEKLEGFRKWKPAMSNGKPIPSSCITVRMVFKDEEISAAILPLNYTERRATQLPPKDPKVLNNKYAYTTKHLIDYDIHVWNAYDSGYVLTSQPPICTDKNGKLTTVGDLGLITRVSYNAKNTFLPMRFPLADGFFEDLERGEKDDWWMIRDNKFYRYVSPTWEYHYRVNSDGFKIYGLTCPKGDIQYLLCTNQGLVTENGSGKTTWTSSTSARLPSDTVLFADADSKFNLWIGTSKGTVKTDPKLNYLAFTGQQECFKYVCITSMTEDEKGNLYFSFAATDRNATDPFSKQGGIIIVKPDGSVEHLSMYNSGLPVLNVKQVLYDNVSKALWLATKTAGLVRYDLKGKWEVYNQLNSPIPSAYVYSIRSNANGDLFVGTDRGIVEMKRQPPPSDIIPDNEGASGPTYLPNTKKK